MIQLLKYILDRINNPCKFILFILLFMCWIRFLIFRFTHKGIYLYLCYGELYDLPFLITAFMGNVYIDIHEVHALKYKDKSLEENIVIRLMVYLIPMNMAMQNTLEKLLKKNIII